LSISRLPPGSGWRDQLVGSNPGAEDFSALYSHYFTRMFAYVYGHVGHIEDTEEIVSEVLEAAYQRMLSPERGPAEPLQAWLFKIAHDAVASRSPRAQRKGTERPPLSWLPEDAIADPERTALAENKEIAAVRTYLKQFPRLEQEIISLKFNAELSNLEIATILGLSEANVRVAVFRTLRRLRERIAATRQPPKDALWFKDLRGLWRGKTRFTYRAIQAAKYRPQGVLP